jgi:hypothetical protein
MGDHDDDAAALANALDGARQRLLALLVEIGVGSSSTTRNGSP